MELQASASLLQRFFLLGPGELAINSDAQNSQLVLFCQFGTTKEQVTSCGIPLSRDSHGLACWLLESHFPLVRPTLVVLMSYFICNIDYSSVSQKLNLTSCGRKSPSNRPSWKGMWQLSSWKLENFLVSCFVFSVHVCLYINVNTIWLKVKKNIDCDMFWNKMLIFHSRHI